MQVVGAIGLLLDLRIGQQVLQTLAYANRTTAWTATTVRSGEGLVQIDVHHVEAHIAGTANAEHRVEIGSIVVHKTTTIVNETSNHRDVSFEDTEGVRVGHHHASHIGTKQWLEILHIYGTIGQALYLDHLEASYSSRSGIGAMGRIGHDDLGACLIATLLMICLDDHKSGQLSMCTSIRIERKARKTGNLGQRTLYLVINLQAALHIFHRGGRMAIETGEGTEFLVELRIVLHSTRAQRIEARINTEVIVRHVGVMANHSKFVTLGKNGLALALQDIRHLADTISTDL